MVTYSPQKTGFEYKQIVQMGDKVLFINTGYNVFTGYIIAIDSSNTIVNMVSIDGVTRYLSYLFCSVEALDGRIYFAMF